MLSAVVGAAWALAGLAALARAPRLGALVLAGAALAGVGLVVDLVGGGSGGHAGVRATLALVVLVDLAATIHLVLALPSGVLGSGARRAAVAWWYALALVAGVVIATSHRALSPWPVAAGWTLAAASAAPVVYTRYGAASASGRQRMQGLCAGAALAGVVATVMVTLHLLVAWPHDVAPTLVATSALVPLGLAAGTRRAAVHADRVLVHLLTILGLVLVVAVTYIVALRGLGNAPHGLTDRRVLWWSMAAAAIATIVNLTARGRFERVATSITYGAREAPDEVVRSFGSRLTRAIPMDELLLQLAESLRKTLTLTSAEIYAGTGEVLELVVSSPDLGSRSIKVSGSERPVIARAGVSGSAWASVWIPAVVAEHADGPVRVAPISHAGELLGLIVVARAEGAVTFREEDDRVLTELARQVGLALHNAQLDTALQSSLDELRQQADELRASRARVVASGDAERRRVERNLHDGAQQHLVALAVNLRIAKDVIAEDPVAGAELLDELGVAVQDTIRELRELAHGIYPPLLVDSGLGEALRAVANRSPLDVALDTEGLARYGGDVEAAVYFCCLEALQNAGKHAAESHVTLRVWEESGGLLFEVADDGPGFDVRRARGGQGYTNMADRLGAIGGAVRWESQVGRGTTIRGSVPLG